MELEKRKREDIGEANAKKGKAAEDDGHVKGSDLADEEVEEFFAILKRIHVAVKYFQERNGSNFSDSKLKKSPWSLKFEPEDFDGVKKETESTEVNLRAGLDLNSDPVCDAD